MHRTRHSFIGATALISLASPAARAGSFDNSEAPATTPVAVSEPVTTETPITEPTAPAATIPAGTYSRIITREEAAAAGADPGFIESEIGDDGLENSYEFTDTGRWTQRADYCDCGVLDRGDFGSYTYDDEGHLVATSDNTDSRGITVVIDWTYADGELSLISFLEVVGPDGNPLPPDPIGTVMVLGTYTVESSSAEAATLRMGVTPGWESLANPVIAAIGELSDETIVVDRDLEWQDAHQHPAVETDIIEAVASGELDIAYVGTRSLDALGVTSFEALTAPFLVDSYALQEAILASDVPTRMLADLDNIGVTGLALAAGPLRHPLGVDAPLSSPADFAGITFHTFRSATNDATAVALGSTHVDVWGEERDAQIDDGTIGATENSLSWVANNGRTSYITANAPLWPATAVVIANPAALAALSEPQRTALHQALADALPTPSQLADIDADLVEELCSAGKQFVEVSSDDVAALRQAVQPVYDTLVTDSITAGYIADIEALKATVAPAAPEIPGTCLAPRDE